MASVNNNLKANVSVHITFKFANDEVFILDADETARDKVMGLKSRIDMWGAPVYIETGTKLQLGQDRRKK